MTEMRAGQGASVLCVTDRGELVQGRGVLLAQRGQLGGALLPRRGGRLRLVGQAVGLRLELLHRGGLRARVATDLD